VGEGDGDRGLELSSAGKFENMRDLAGDLLGAKNAGVTFSKQQFGANSLMGNILQYGDLPLPRKL
jgi:hypothetical protein